MASIYTVKSQAYSTNKKLYESESGPFEDEIYIRNLKEQNKNAPVFNGAFMKVYLFFRNLINKNSVKIMECQQKQIIKNYILITTMQRF